MYVLSCIDNQIMHAEDLECFLLFDKALLLLPPRYCCHWAEIRDNKQANTTVGILNKPYGEDIKLFFENQVEKQA